MEFGFSIFFKDMGVELRVSHGFQGNFLSPIFVEVDIFHSHFSPDWTSSIFFCFADEKLLLFGEFIRLFFRVH